MSDDGGPAFPSRHYSFDDGGAFNGETTDGGMSLRDWFAGRALEHLACFQAPDLELPPPKMAAEYAYKVADAMLAEREKADV